MCDTPRPSGVSRERSPRGARPGGPPGARALYDEVIKYAEMNHDVEFRDRIRSIGISEFIRFVEDETGLSDWTEIYNFITAPSGSAGGGFDEFYYDWREKLQRGSPPEGSQAEEPLERTRAMSPSERIRRARVTSPEQHYSVNNGLLSVFQHESNTMDFINELVNIEERNNEYWQARGVGDSRVVRIINIYIRNDGALFYSNDDFVDLLKSPSDQQLLPTDPSRSNKGRVGFSQQKTAAGKIMGEPNRKRMLLTHIQEIFRESQITHADLFSNCNYVMVTIDIYLNRLYSQIGFHHDSTTAFPSKFVWLSYRNEIPTPGPEIIFCSNLKEQFRNQTCKYLRPSIPRHGTIVFADELVYHSTPYGTLIPFSNHMPGDHKLRRQHEALLQHTTRDRFGMSMDFENIQPEGTRKSWLQTPTTPRSFIRGWVIPITAEMEHDYLRLMTQEGLENERINFGDTPTTTPLTDDELYKIAFLG